MKAVSTVIGVLVVGASVLSLGLANQATASTLVTCGPGGAARVVDKVPPGCRVLLVNAPPLQAGNQ